MAVPDDLAAGAAAWQASLSPEQERAVLVYGSGNFADINKALRDCGDTPECLGGYAETYRHLSAAVAAAPDFKPLTAYRGMRIADGAKAQQFLDAAQASLDEGGTVRLKGLTSMTLNPKVTNHFINEEHGKQGLAVLLRVRAHGGAFTSAVTGPEAAELVHGHGTEYRVTNLDERDDGTVVVDMVQVRKAK